MRYFLILVFVAVVVMICYGFYVKPENAERGELFIGLSIAGLFFVWMPAFVYHRWKNKNLKDYMLTQENIEKMQKVGKEKKL